MGQIARAYVQLEVLKAMDIEKQERITRDKMVSVSEQLIRSYNQRYAMEAMYDEKETRVYSDYFKMAVLSELPRQQRKLSNNNLMTREKFNQDLYAEMVFRVWLAFVVFFPFRLISCHCFLFLWWTAFF